MLLGDNLVWVNIPSRGSSKAPNTASYLDENYIPQCKPVDSNGRACNNVMFLVLSFSSIFDVNFSFFLIRSAWCKDNTRAMSRTLQRLIHVSSAVRPS